MNARSRNTLRAITTNVRGLASSPAKLRSLYKAISRVNNTCAVLTESNLDSDTLNLPTHKPPPNLASFTSRDPTQVLGSGVTVVASTTLTPSNFTVLLEGYVVCVTITLGSHSALVFGVYNPPNNLEKTRAVLDCIHAEIARAQNPFFLILGDLNATFRDQDRSSRRTNAHDTQWRNFIVARVDAYDSFAHIHPRETKYTYTSAHAQSRLDHVLVSSSLLPTLTYTDIQGGQLKAADHYAVVAKFNARHLATPEHTSTTSRVPTTDMYDTPLNARGAQVINSFPVCTSQDTKETWDHVLNITSSLARFMTLYTRGKAHRLRRRVTRLRTRLANARDTPTPTHAQPNPRPQNFATERKLNAELAEYERELDARKAIDTNRRLGFDADECDYTTHLLAGRVTSTDTDRTATALLHPNTNAVHTDTLGMCDASRAYYETLLGPRPHRVCPSRDVFLPSIPTLAADTQARLVRPVTLAEVKSIFKDLKTRKAPGLDGISNDILKRFSAELAPHFIPLLNNFLARPWLPEGVLTAVIAPVYKGSGPKENLDNWRPLTLVNTTYKLVSLFLMRRLNPHMSDLVLPGQTNAVPGRTIFDNVHSVRLAHLAATLQDADAAFAFIDSTKAFDYVEWPYLWTTLEVMGLPPEFIACIKALYTGASACTRVNGFLSGSFTLGRGVRQGCPLSPLLYVLALEPLRHFLHEKASDPSRTRFLPDNFPPTQTHADDITYIVPSKYLFADLAQAQLYAHTKLHSGFLINWKKTIFLYTKKESVPPPQTLTALTQSHGLGASVRVAHWDDPHDCKHLGLAIGGPAPDRQAIVTARIRLEAKLRLFGPSTVPPLQKARTLVSRYGGAVQYYAQSVGFTHQILHDLMKNVTRAFWGAPSREHYSISAARLPFPRSLGGTGLLHLPTWVDAFHRVRLIRLTQGVSRPEDDPDNPPALADPSIIIILKRVIELCTLPHAAFDPATFFWQSRLVRERITAQLPVYWQRVIDYFEREIAPLHTLCHACAPNPAPRDVTLAAAVHRVPFPPCPGTHTHPTLTEAVEALPGDLHYEYHGHPGALLNHPAYMMPFNIDPGPRRPANRHMARKPPRTVQFHYVHMRTAHMNANARDLSAESDWVAEFPALHVRQSTPPGRIDAGPKDPLAPILRFTHGQRYSHLTSHSWKLFHGRLDAPWRDCPWCGAKAATFPSRLARFIHVAWGCRGFQTHWGPLRTRAGLRQVHSITDIALGLSPDGNKRLPERARLHATALHAAIWYHFYRGTRSATNYDTILAYYRRLTTRPDFFDPEVDPDAPHMPSGLV